MTKIERLKNKMTKKDSFQRVFGYYGHGSRSVKTDLLIETLKISPRVLDLLLSSRGARHVMDSLGDLFEAKYFVRETAIWLNHDHPQDFKRRDLTYIMKKTA